MKHIVFTIFLITSSFALTPFSLEGIQSVNIKLFDKSKLVSKELKQKIVHQIESEFTKLGIKTKSDNFSNFIVKIEAIQIEKTYAVNITMFLAEDVIPSRDQSLQSLGITYRKSDFFTTQDLEEELYESIIDFLLFDFIEQYKDENS
jgi:hypothetical protein